MAICANPETLRVHQLASELANQVIAEVRTFPYLERHAIGDQLIRAAVAIAANIAEASGRGTVPEFRRFLWYARGSSQELLTLLGIARASQLGKRESVMTLRSRTALVLKMVARLHEHPPPTR